MRSDRELAGSGRAPGRAAKPARYALLAAAATILLAALLVTVSRVGDPTRGLPVYRAGEEAAIESLLPADAALPRERALLRWTPLGEDALYSVEVGTLDLRSLAAGHDMEVPEFLIPAEVLETVGEGESIVWQVEAALPDGRHVSSEAFVTPVE
jgi:hypothetical protein